MTTCPYCKANPASEHLVFDDTDESWLACCKHCGCTDDRTGHDDTCSHGCNDINGLADFRVGGKEYPA